MNNFKRNNWLCRIFNGIIPIVLFFFITAVVTNSDAGHKKEWKGSSKSETGQNSGNSDTPTPVADESLINPSYTPTDSTTNEDSTPPSDNRAGQRKSKRK
ncbi:MAG: hypothetical protein JW795_07510 [Chitinivibrionales bacterium]|nr:hypothetical protein [Chitinivibrionales bacterium]